VGKVTSDTSGSVPFTVIPAGWYPARLVRMEKTVSKKQPDGTGGNPMFVFGFDITGHNEDPRLNNRQVNFYNVVYGGKDKNGAPNNLNRLLELIGAAGVPWDHVNCGAIDQTAAPVEDKDMGVYLCPACSKSLNEDGTQIAYDPDLFKGRMIKMQITVGKSLNSDEPRNEIRRVRAL